MDLDSLTALSPVDGRYGRAVDTLRDHLSESGLIRERIRVEAAWLLALTSEVPQILREPLSPAVHASANSLAAQPAATAAAEVKAIEQRINHDVKAVEYYVRDQLQVVGANAATLELVHFGCTSEDINNLAYARMLQRARVHMLTHLDGLIATLRALAHDNAALAMLARTHGQPASPTTLGKEFANVVARLVRARRRWHAVEILGKWNGAVGNYNAHVAALPTVDWPGVSRRFVESLDLTWNEYTTQIEPHDWIAEYADAVAATNVILIDLARDIWGYVSLGYLRQRAAAGEVGSSTMPHKVNPIDFENAEGNLGLANTLLRHFSDKLPVSRWQRDLTDSTVLRNVGVALAHSQIAWHSLARGLGKIEADPARIAAELGAAHEVLGEAIQTVLRAAGVPHGYETLKDFTRGQRIDQPMLAEFIASLPLVPAERARLLAIQPADYVGLAAQLARKA
ncbi:MAG: adenylosuccinate lyase [Steroidobacteraceae bacterium]